MSFTTRAFSIPEKTMAVAKQAMAGEKGALTRAYNRHKDNLGDYSPVLQWLRNLSKQFNWAGPTMGFHYVVANLAKEQEGQDRFRQIMFEDDGQPCGYLRLVGLSKDTLTRNADCMKIEESLVSDKKYVIDPSLLRFMYDEAMGACEDMDRKRLVTEINIGFSPQRFRSLAFQIRRLTNKLGTDEEDPTELARVKSLFERDWVTVSANFIEEMGCNITDVIIPQDLESFGSAAQFRMTRIMPGKRPVKLPNYQADHRNCHKYTGKKSLAPLRQAIEIMKENALKAHPTPVLKS